MTANKRITIIGATSAMAEYCARLWADNTLSEMILVGRQAEKLKPIAEDLQVRAPQAKIICRIIDFMNSDNINALAQEICHEKMDIVLIAHGFLSNQAQCQQDLAQVQQALEINGISPVLFAEAFAKYLEQNNHGSLVLIGSVAGDRGRKSNYVYGAGKSLISTYVQGLQHRFAHSNVHIMLVKPGPTATPMTAHLAQQGEKLANVEQVAQDIVNSVNKRKRVVYTPKVWAIIMLIIRHLPHMIFKKMDI